MSVVLKIKRSAVTATPSQLANGELAYSELSQNLFFGSTAGVIKIGGLSDVTKLAGSTALATADALVQRDAQGGFAAGAVTVTDLLTSGTTANLFNTGATTINAFGAATAINIGAAGGETVIRGDVRILGALVADGGQQVAGTVAFDDIAVNGGDITTTATAATLFNQANVATLALGTPGSTTITQAKTVVKGHVTKAAADAMAVGTMGDAFKVTDSAGVSLFQVKDNGDTVIAGVLTVNGTGTSTFAGNVAIGGSITVAEGATVTADFTADTATITGNLSVNGNTALGNDSTDTTTITGTAAVVGNASVSGDLSVSGSVSINGSITVAQSATVAADFSADTATITGNLSVNGNTVLGNDPADTTTINGATTLNGDTSVAGNLTVAGNLVVNGTTTSVNSTQTTLTDPVLSLAQDTAAADSFDRGVDFKWHNGTAVKTGFMGWDDSAEKFTLLSDATATSGEYAGTAGSLMLAGLEASAEIRAKAGINGLAADGVTKTEITNAIVDGGTF